MNQEITQKYISELTHFLQQTFAQNNKKNGTIAVSGGIDSALATTLLVRAIGPENVYPVFLPYKSQSTVDSKLLCSWNKIPEEKWNTYNIEQLVTAACATLPGAADHQMRLGNIMARSRMIVLYDVAKELNALVCGTENKSEKYLGYFTRFGDEASDVEPIQSLYKTEVRELVAALKLPAVFLDKAPSAGLWEDQTDERELGFSYAEADAVLQALIEKDGGKLYVQLIEGDRAPEVCASITKQLPKVSAQTVQAVVERVQSQQFKQEVPYTYI